MATNWTDLPIDIQTQIFNLKEKFEIADKIERVKRDARAVKSKKSYIEFIEKYFQSSCRCSTINIGLTSNTILRGMKTPILIPINAYEHYKYEKFPVNIYIKVVGIEEEICIPFKVSTHGVKALI